MLIKFHRGVSLPLPWCIFRNRAPHSCVDLWVSCGSGVRCSVVMLVWYEGRFSIFSALSEPDWPAATSKHAASRQLSTFPFGTGMLWPESSTANDEHKVGLG